jgi:hypothetical protein
MAGIVVLVAFNVAGLAFMLWVIVALEFELHRMRRRSNQFEQGLRRR